MALNTAIKIVDNKLRKKLLPPPLSSRRGGAALGAAVTAVTGTLRTEVATDAASDIGCVGARAQAATRRAVRATVARSLSKGGSEMTRRLIIVATACQHDGDGRRAAQYTLGVQCLRNALYEAGIDDAEIVLVDGNGDRPTVLNTLAVSRVVYTNNNAMPTANRGKKELADVLAVLDAVGAQPDDFVVKLTARYIVAVDSPFLEEVKKARDGAYDVVARFGSYMHPLGDGDTSGDVITGLIGATAAVVRAIREPAETQCVEWLWASAALTVPRDRIRALGQLGAAICPQSDTYFFNV